MEMIKDRERIHCHEYYLDYRWSDCPGSGFSFGCNEKGEVDLAAMQPAGRENYEKCLSGEHDVIFRGLKKREWSYIQPAVGRCHCGDEVTLYGFTNTCEKCGADYNSSGQLLAPRSQWGEETGETAADILGCDSMSAEKLLEGDDY